mgnify:FL=1
MANSIAKYFEDMANHELAKYFVDLEWLMESALADHRIHDALVYRRLLARARTAQEEE